MKPTATKRKPSKSTANVKDLPPRKDPRGGGSVDKIAINHNEALIAEGAWIG